MDVTEVERGIPIPVSRRPRGRGIRLGGLEPGDSVRVDYPRRGALSTAIMRQKFRTPERDFTTRVLLDETTGEKYIRAWRTA